MIFCGISPTVWVVMMNGLCQVPAILFRAIKRWRTTGAFVPAFSWATEHLPHPKMHWRHAPKAYPRITAMCGKKYRDSDGGRNGQEAERVADMKLLDEYGASPASKCAVGRSHHSTPWLMIVELGNIEARTGVHRHLLQKDPYGLRSQYIRNAETWAWQKTRLCQNVAMFEHVEQDQGKMARIEARLGTARVRYPGHRPGPRLRAASGRH